MQTKPNNTTIALRHYLRQIWIQRRYSIPALLLPGIGDTLNRYVPPLIVAATITRFADSPAKPTLAEVAPYLGLFAAAWLGGELLWRIAFLLLNRADSRGIHNLYVDAMDELFRKDIGFFHNNFAGALTKRTIGYAKNFENFLDTLAFNVSANVLPLIFVVIILWRLSPLLVLTLIGTLSIVIAILVPLTKRRKRLVVIREEAGNKTAGYVADMISNMDAIQAFANESYEAKRHRRNVADYTDKARKSWDYHTIKVDMLISPIYVAINIAGLALALTQGKDAATLAATFITFSYFANATRILWEFNRVYRGIENSLTEAAQFTELLNDEPQVKEIDRPERLHIARGEVAFQHVSFAYHASQDKLFQDLNLHIRPGERIALVGHSGGGKTTITKLLLRFVDATNGSILIDGQDIARGKLKDLRSAIAFVPQEPIMFHRTIRENIRYGKLDATDDEVEQAAMQANAHKFISKLPDGYDTLVGERGVKLSGGQRQRIAIARAIIKDAPILVLDEATSALDSASERLIQDALWRLMEHRTAIVIAHRLSTIQKMDRIIVLDDGAIAEQGTHDELLQHDGIYAGLWSHQSGGFIKE